MFEHLSYIEINIYFLKQKQTYYYRRRHLCQRLDELILRSCFTFHNISSIQDIESSIESWPSPREDKILQITLF